MNREGAKDAKTSQGSSSHREETEEQAGSLLHNPSHQGFG